MAKSKATKTTAKAKTKTTKTADNKNKALPKIFDNPLLQQKSTELTITPAQEVEQKVEIINEIESLATISKQQLAVRRERVQLEIENKKLDAAKQTINAAEKIIDSILEPGVIARVTAKINTPQDMKFMAETLEKLSNTLKGFMSNNPVDELGNKKKTKINFMFKTSGATQGVIQVDSGNEDD